MNQVQSDAKILEDGETALHDAVKNDDTTGEKVEYSDLSELKPEGEQVETLATKPQQKPETPAPVEDDIPTEYKGKSLKDVIRMHQDAHRLIGRQGTELGELRGRADQALRISLEALRRNQAAAVKPPAEKAQETEELDESAFFNKPSEAIAKAIASNPVIKEIQRTLGAHEARQASSRAQANAEMFNRAHPDAGEIMRDPEFRKWVGGSQIRQSLLRRADQNFDFAAGDEVFSTWKALRGASRAQSKAGEQTPQASEVSAAAATLAKARQAKAEAAAKAAAVPTAGAGAPAKPSGGKRIYRRADVVRLMTEDPDRYEQLADEIRIAYEEGRVR